MKYLLLILAFTLLLVGCGGSGGDSDDEEDPTAPGKGSMGKL